MSVKFDGVDFPGTHGDCAVLPPKTRAVRSSFWGLNGVSEIRPLMNYEREIHVEIWIHDNFYYSRDLERWLLDREQQELNAHGELVIQLDDRPTGRATRRRNRNTTRTFEDCTLDMIERIPLPGQDRAVPLYDYVGQMGGWFQPVLLHFTQLLVDER